MRTITEKEELSFKETLKHVVNDMELEGHNLTEAQIEQIYAESVEEIIQLKERGNLTDNPFYSIARPILGDIAAIRADAARRSIKK
jgi:hypothetical protein